jgi:WD40 repeat protein
VQTQLISPLLTSILTSARRLPVLAACALTASCAHAAAPVSFSRQVLPLLRAQCWACHSGTNPASGYSMETRDRLLAGGRHGADVLPGKGARSGIVQYLTGELKPKMPPNGAIDLEKIAIIRRWIDEGARVDSMNVPSPAPLARTSAQPSPQIAAVRQAAPVTALAYSPDGSTLAAGGYRAVRLLDAKTGSLVRAISGPADQVQALAWSSDGRLLAAAGGVPGKSGEVAILDAQTGQTVRTLVGHTEVVYAVAWKPGGREIATGSLDKTAIVWDAATGRPLHTIKDHADPVLSVAYSPDGKLLATGSGDRTAKLFDTATWKRTDTLSAHQDAVTHVAFNNTGTLLATVGADKQMRVWKVDPGKMENPLRTQGEGDVINTCAFSPDGSLLVWGASNDVVKVFNADGSGQKREMRDAKDWIYCVAVGADNDTVAAGTQDGKIYFWSVRDGKCRLTIDVLPDGPKVETVSEQRK